MKGKIGIVARREFVTTIRRPSYVISTLGMPLFAVLLGGIAMIPALIVAKKESRPQTIGILDPAGVLALGQETEFAVSLPAEVADLLPRDPVEKAFAGARKIRLRPYPTLESGKEALRSGAISSLVEFPESYMKEGKVTAYRKEGLFGPGKATGYDILRRFVVARLLAEGHVDPDLAERVRAPLTTTTLVLTKDGSIEPQDLAREITSLAVPILFTVLFFVSVTMSSGFLLQGVSEEKESRVIEVILSSVRAEDLLAGKLIGLGGAGLLQILAWLSLVLVPAAALIPSLHLRSTAILASIVFYLLGFLLFGVLLTGTGSLGQNLKESQQYAMMWSLASAVPMMFMMLLISEPNGLAARILSFIPLTAPGTMFLRLNAAEPPPWWEVVLAAAALAAAVWIAHRVMTKLFRIGLLLYGKSPTIPEILRLLRRPAA